VHPREAFIVPRWQAALYALALLAMTVLALYLGVT
jgi:hypothetical protein